MSAELSGRRVVGLVAFTTAVFCGAWAAVFVLIVAVRFAPSAHLTFSAWDRFIIVAIPTAVAAVAMAVTEALLDRWTFGPTDERRSTTGRRWGIRLLSPLLIFFAVMSYQEVSFRRAVAAARTSYAQAGLTGATASLAGSDRGRRALVDIVGDGRVAVPNRVEAAIKLEKPERPPIPEVDALVRELLNDPDPSVRVQAPSIVFWMPMERAWPFTRTLLDDQDEAVVLRALDILERAFLNVDEGVLEQIGRLMTSGAPAVRAKTRKHYLSQVTLRTETSRRQARSLLDSPDQEVRVIAASRLANAGDVSGASAVLAVLSENPQGSAPQAFDLVREAIFVLMVSKGEQAAPVLWTLARCPSVSSENRDYARFALDRWFKDRAPDGQTAVVPDDYRDADAVSAPSRPVWRHAYCRP